ncbi:MAG TPA: molybdenum cofactor biosynthesis protein MoaE [Burkholderiales bacterium]|nr:molybdenum cofactor biosynthesis protein MoaE [Burkholderiales bacterium]
MKVGIQESDFDVLLEMEEIRKNNPNVGAIVSFVGLVRDFGGSGKVKGMMLEHYPGMTEKCLETLLNEAMERWEIVDATVVHRIGRLFASDQIVLVLVAGHHRKEAFRAAEFVIDRLKTEAPLWKKEETEEGWRWVDAKASDEAASSEWE